MSVAALSEADKIYKKSFHRKNDSGELDVFEAARYFSGGNEIIGYNGNGNGAAAAAAFPQRMMMREESSSSSRQAWRGGRISLDMPMTMRNTLPAAPQHSSSHYSHSHSHAHAHAHTVEKQIKEKIKYKQPSSPGGRLASFLNSLFNQTNSKKKKSKSTAQSIKDIDQEESPGGRRKRRSSISHFRSSSSTTADSKSLYSSSSSGFRTPPPPYANTPTKTYKDFRSYSDHRQLVSLPNNNNNGNINVQGTTTGTTRNEALDEKRIKELAWLDEKIKFKFSSNGFSEKHKNFMSINGISEKERIWDDDDDDEYPSEERELKEFRKLDNDDDGDADGDGDGDGDGAESDSSSDLFELQNYELGCCYSSGLRVYETTHMDTIKRGARAPNPISNSNVPPPLPLPLPLPL